MAGEVPTIIYRDGQQVAWRVGYAWPPPSTSPSGKTQVTGATVYDAASGVSYWIQGGSGTVYGGRFYRPGER
ncbi:MAG: hypothetical protein MMC33_004580 [Icmadophila ericetorum]|nr:hypothetical protein [Icmadophila ericetorum]